MTRADWAGLAKVCGIVIAAKPARTGILPIVAGIPANDPDYFPPAIARCA